MRIAQVNLQRDYGGAERHVGSLARGLRDCGHKVYLFCHPNGGLARSAARDGLNTVSLVARSQLDPAAILHFARQLRRLRPDVLHLHTPRDYMAGTLAGRLAKVPVVTLTRHMMMPVKPHMHRLYRRVEAVICPSRTLYDHMLSQGVPGEKLVMIQGAIEALRLEDVSPEIRSASRRALELNDSDLVLGIIGRLVRGKGHDFLLDAFSELSAASPKLLIIGEGPERAALQAHMERLRLTGQVIFTGFREDVSQLMSVLDIVVLASTDTEVMPLVVMEALAAGRAVAATRVGGVPEIIADGEHGLLAPPRDARALAAVLQRLADAPDLRARLGAAGAKRFSQQFALPRMVAETEQLFQQLHFAKSTRG